MSFLRVTVRPARCYLLGRRVHHGFFGLLLLAHDWRDWRVWVMDFIRHPV